MKQKNIFALLLVILLSLPVFSQTIDYVGPEEIVALSVNGRNDISSGDPSILTYSKVYTNVNAVWDDSTFTAPRYGIYVVTISFVKDSYYNNGTTDDVYITVRQNNVSKGRAWSGEGAGRRDTATYTVVLELEEGDTVTTYSSSAVGKKRFITEYNLSIYTIKNNYY